MKQSVDWLIRHYGTAATLHTDGEPDVTVRAFVQPLTGKSLQNMHSAFAGVGELAPGQTLYLGPAGAPLGQVDWVGSGGKTYLVRRCERMVIGGETLYEWGLLVPGGGADPWNS